MRKQQAQVISLSILFACLQLQAAAWVRAIDGGARRLDSATSVAVDGQGNVLAAGAMNAPIARDYVLGEFTVIKFDGDTGDEIWRTALRACRKRVR